MRNLTAMLVKTQIATTRNTKSDMRVVEGREANDAASDAEKRRSLRAEGKSMRKIASIMNTSPTRVFRTIHAVGTAPSQVRLGSPPELNADQRKRVQLWIAGGMRNPAQLHERVLDELKQQVSIATVYRAINTVPAVPRPSELLVFKNRRRKSSKQRLFELLRSTRKTLDL